MSALGQAGPCDFCGSPIMWLLTGLGKLMPVDATPDVERGNVLRKGDNAAVLGRGPAAGARATGQQLHLHHRLTCPYASKWARGETR